MPASPDRGEGQCYGRAPERVCENAAIPSVHQSRHSPSGIASAYQAASSARARSPRPVDAVASLIQLLRKASSPEGTQGAHLNRRTASDEDQ